MFPAITSLKELMIKYSDEKVCRAYLEHLRWNGNPVCPHCGVNRPYRINGGKAFRCRSKECRKDFSVTVGLVFENSKIPLSTWFAAIYLVSAHKKGISSCQLARDLSITQKTAWFLLHRIREMFCSKEELELSNIVEVDETYVGGKWDNMHNSKKQRLRASGKDNKVPIMGLVERGGKLCLKKIGETDGFKDFVHKYVVPDAVVVTDAHLSYRGLDESHKGHMIVNHSQGEYKVGIYHTNTIEGFFSILKRGIYGIYHQVSPKHIHRYCEEFSYRYNTRKIKDNERFVLTLQNSEGRLKYEQLIAKQK
jgi:transposase-like protein